MDKEIGQNNGQNLSVLNDEKSLSSSKNDQEAKTASDNQKISSISELAKNLSNKLENVSNLKNSSKICNLSPLGIDDLPNPLSSNSKEKPNQSKSSFIANQDINVDFNQDSNDVVDVMPKEMAFTWFDILLNLFSIFCYIIDVISDVITSVVHYKTKNFIFFYLTLTFIIVPTLITTFISLRWYIIDAKNESGPFVSRKRWIIRSLFLFFQMGQIMRYIDSLLFGIKYMNKPDVKFYQYMVNEDTDATMLRLFECFLESAPQLLIQLYLIIMVPIDTKKLSNKGFLFYVLFPYFSCCISLFSISLAIASYYKSLRMSLPDKVNLSMIEMGVQVLWRLFMLGSRILALTLFLTSFDYLIIFILIFHWLLMFLWILTMKTNFCENAVEEVCYDALVAIMFIFCMFNPVDNDTRPRYTIFFIFMFIENSILLYFWSEDCANKFNHNLPCNYKIELISLYYICFLTGIVIMIIYYLYCHPSKNIKLFRTKEDLEIDKRRHSYASRDQQRRVFNEHDWANELEIKRLKNQLSQTFDSADIKEIGKVKKVFRRRKFS